MLPPSSQAWEATQLVSALLAVLVVVHEDSLQPVHKEEFSWLLGPHYDTSTITWNPKHPKTACELIRRIRNGLAHFRWEFAPPTGKIEAMRITDQPCRNCGNPDFKIELTIKQLEDVFKKIVSLITGTPGQASGGTR
jgi:hypothetical protein